MIYEDITQTIGRTPVVRINRLAPEHVTMYVKLEAANPGGSVKDRLALGIVEDAERRGQLKPGATVVEATSGNTGIALALVCAARGYSFVSIMPESFSVERRQIMRAYGAKVVLTPAAERASGAVRLAEKLAAERGWFLARQFDNEANPAYHRQTTGPEILSDFADRRLDYWITGYGTGGTLTGAGQMIKCARPETKIVACEPVGAALLDGKEWKPHKIQGWTPDFIPSVLDRDVYDELIAVNRGERRASDRDRARSRAQGRHLLRHLRRRHDRGRARGRSEGAAGRGAARDVARHRRALPVDGVVRRRAHRIGRAVERPVDPSGLAFARPSESRRRGAR
jgi:cysteine synthase A